MGVGGWVAPTANLTYKLGHFLSTSGLVDGQARAARALVGTTSGTNCLLLTGGSRATVQVPRLAHGSWRGAPTVEVDRRRF